jgi:hypothetical protein
MNLVRSGIFQSFIADNFDFISGLMLTTRERDLIIISANWAQVQGLVTTETEIIAC